MPSQSVRWGLALCAALVLFSGRSLAWQAQALSTGNWKTPLFPLAEIRPGMKGVGRTVFEGSKVEEFQVEILGVLWNVAPRQNVILARLSGGPLERTGVMAGMSGSPVYIDGRLVGAVALGFQFSKEPIAGITPIEQMLAAFEEKLEAPATPGPQIAWTMERGVEGADPRIILLKTPDLLPPLASQSNRVQWGGVETSLVHVGTPLVFSGFTQGALQSFEPQLRSLGWIPVQGGGGGAAQDQSLADASRLEPGSMISVQLVRGDLEMHADGTVTMVDQGRVYAFGHPFLSAGPTEIPFSESQVVAMLPGLATSMKISTPGRLLGVIGQDRASGVFGMVGSRARMIPVELDVLSNRRNGLSYRFEVVNDRFLLPFLVNLTVFSALGATERMVGESTLRVEQTISLQGLPEVKLENFISGPANAPALAAQSAALPLAYLMQSGLGPADVRSIRLRVFATDERLVQELEQVWSSQREVRAGEPLELTVLLRGQDGKEAVRKTTVAIPASLTPGPLTIMVADGTLMDRLEAGRGGRPILPRNPQQLVRAINKSRRNNRLYIRLSRYEPGFALQGENFPSPPPSVVRALSADLALSTGISQTFFSTLADYEMEPLAGVVSGFKNITVMVKE